MATLDRQGVVDASGEIDDFSGGENRDVTRFREGGERGRRWRFRGRRGPCHGST